MRRISVSGEMMEQIKTCLADAEDDANRKTCIANVIGGSS